MTNKDVSTLIIPTKTTKTINKQLWTGKALDFNKEASEILWSSKTETGHLEKHRKHFTCTTPYPSPEQLSTKRDPFRRILTTGKEKRTWETWQASLPWMFSVFCSWGPPQSLSKLNLADRATQSPCYCISSSRMELSCHCSKTCSQVHQSQLRQML